MSDLDNPYAGEPLADIIYDFGRTRGDLSEQYAREQMHRAVLASAEYIAVAEAARAEALREIERDLHVHRFAHQHGHIGGPDTFYRGVQWARNHIRIRALSSQPAAAGCPTEGCGGDGRYAAPGRGHAEGCTYPLPAAARTEVESDES